LAKSGLFADGGSPVHGGEDSPDAKLETVAKGLIEKNPELTKAAAMVKAAELHPELYDARRSN